MTKIRKPLHFWRNQSGVAFVELFALFLIGTGVFFFLAALVWFFLSLMNAQVLLLVVVVSTVLLLAICYRALTRISKRHEARDQAASSSELNKRTVN